MSRHITYSTNVRIILIEKFLVFSCKRGEKMQYF